LFAVVAAAGVSVAIAGLASSPPRNVNLAALWKINPDLSDDPQKAVSKKRAESSSSGPTGARRRGGGNTGIDVGDIFGGGTVIIGGGVPRGGGGGSGDRPADDPDQPESMRMPLDWFLATREELEIEQQPDAVTIRTLEDTSTCKPAQADKVPVPNGEMVDRHCGWQGSAFVVELKSGDGITRLNRYELRKNGQQLIVTSEVKGGHGQLSGLQIKRVYERALAF
jgi:hypothetical protein